MDDSSGLLRLAVEGLVLTFLGFIGYLLRNAYLSVRDALGRLDLTLEKLEEAKHQISELEAVNTKRLQEEQIRIAHEQDLERQLYFLKGLLRVPIDGKPNPDILSNGGPTLS